MTNYDYITSLNIREMTELLEKVKSLGYNDLNKWLQEEYQYIS